MYQLFYVSNATGQLDAAGLRRILVTARETNRSLDVTGMLLFRNGTFAQVLEGREGDVLALMDAIRKDERHSNVTTMFEGKVAGREFADWSMAYRDLSGESRDLAGFSDFLNQPTPDRCELSAGPSQTSTHLLNVFKRALEATPEQL